MTDRRGAPVPGCRQINALLSSAGQRCSKSHCAKRTCGGRPRWAALASMPDEKSTASTDWLMLAKGRVLAGAAARLQRGAWAQLAEHAAAPVHRIAGRIAVVVVLRRPRVVSSGDGGWRGRRRRHPHRIAKPVPGRPAQSAAGIAEAVRACARRWQLRCRLPACVWRHTNAPLTSASPRRPVNSAVTAGHRSAHRRDHCRRCPAAAAGRSRSWRSGPDQCASVRPVALTVSARPPKPNRRRSISTPSNAAS